MSSRERYDSWMKIYTIVKQENHLMSFQMQVLATALNEGPTAGVFNRDLVKKYIQWAEYWQWNDHRRLNEPNPFETFFEEPRYPRKNWANAIPHLVSSVNYSNILFYLQHFAYESKGDLSDFTREGTEYLTCSTVRYMAKRVTIYLSK